MNTRWLLISACKTVTVSYIHAWYSLR